MSDLASSGFLILNIVVILLNTCVLYAHQTITRQYTIYHNQPLNPALILRLEQAHIFVKTCEVFDKILRLEVCLNNESRYPSFVQTIWIPILM